MTYHALGSFSSTKMGSFMTFCRLKDLNVNARVSVFFPLRGEICW